jgi:hypothetical protein
MTYIHRFRDSLHVSNIHWAKDIWIICLSISKIYTFNVVMILKILSSFVLKYTVHDDLVPGTQMELEDHYAQWNKSSTDTVLILANEFFSPLIQCPGASRWCTGAESMMSVPCSVGGIEMKPLWLVVGCVQLHIAPCLCDVSDYWLNGENEPKSQDKLSWSEPQRDFWRGHNLSTQFLHKRVLCQLEMLHGQGVLWRYPAQFLVRIIAGHHC